MIDNNNDRKIDQLGTVQKTNGSTEQKLLESKKGKKNKCMGISSNKQMKSYTRKLGYSVTYWPLTQPSIKEQVHPVKDIRV